MARIAAPFDNESKHGIRRSIGARLGEFREDVDSRDAMIQSWILLLNRIFSSFWNAFLSLESVPLVESVQNGGIFSQINRFPSFCHENECLHFLESTIPALDPDLKSVPRQFGIITSLFDSARIHDTRSIFSRPGMR